MKKIKIILFIILIGTITMLCLRKMLPHTTKANDSENGIEVSENSEIVYYITVSHQFDSDIKWTYTETSMFQDSDVIKSDYIFVEDQLPLGLEFKDFITTLDGSIGAYSPIKDGIFNYRDAYNNPIYEIDSTCDGYVINDTNDTNVLTGTWNNDHTEYVYHGLHYNTNTRKVSFVVDDLSPNCVLTVGVVVETPSLEVGQTRLDFYNIANAITATFTEISNIVYHFMGSDSETLYQVNYLIDYDNDGNYDNIFDESIKYPSGEEVSLPLYPTSYWEQFDGWTSDDVTITDGKFIMPSQDIEIIANVSEAPTYTVTYSIDGYVPERFTIPSQETYYPNQIVRLNSIKKGDVIDGYEFLGWEVTGASFGDDDKFVMPSNDVTVVGRFAEKEYTITYHFEQYDLPSNIANLLPEPQKYKAGEIVHLPTFTPQGEYVFYGWQSEDNFKMPEKDLTILGYWKLYGGIIIPTITLERVNNDFVKPGDDVILKVDVEYNERAERYLSYPNINMKFNTNAVELYDIDTEESTPVTGDSEFYYNIEQYGTTFYIKYHVGYDELVSTTARIRLVDFYGTSTEDTKFDLPDEVIEATLDIDIIPRFMLCSKNNALTSSSKFYETYKITGLNGFETTVSLNNACMIYFLNPGKYKVQQLLPYYFKNISISGIINSDNTEFTLDGSDDEYLIYTNGYKDLATELPYYYANKSWNSYGTLKDYILPDCIPTNVEGGHSNM